MTNILELLKNEKVEWKKLGEVGEILSGLKGVTAEDFKLGSTRYIPYITVFNNYEITNSSMVEIVRIKNIEKQNFVKKGDILFTASSENKEDAGMTSVVTETLEEETYLNSFCFIYRFSNDIEILPGFSKHLFRSIEFRKKISNTAQGVTRFNVSKDRILSIEIPIPSLETQEKIVKILDKFTNYVMELQSELQSRTKQYTYYRDKLLSEEYLNKVTKEMEEDRRLDMVTLGEIGKFTRGNGLQKKDFQEEGNPVIHYGQIYTKYGFIAEKVLSYVNDEIFSKLRKAQKNDILIATTSENIEDVGKSVVWLGEDEIGFSGDMYSYRTEQNSKYIAYYFQTNAFQRQKERKVTGTKMIRIHGDDMEKFEIPLPPLSLQNKIVKVLDKFQVLLSDTKGLIPEEIEQRQKQYEYYREKLLTFDAISDRFDSIRFITSVYYDILQEAANIVEVDIQDKVEIINLGEISSINRGASPRPIKSFISNEIENSVPWIKIGDTKPESKYIVDTKERITKEGAKKSRVLKKGSFILSNSMSYGRPYILSIDGAIHDGWASINDFEQFLVSDYLYHYLITKRTQDYWQLKMNTASVSNLNSEIIRGLPILVPPLHVQQHVVSILDKFDTLVNDIKVGLPKEIEQRQKQYEYWRECLLKFPR